MKPQPQFVVLFVLVLLIVALYAYPYVIRVKTIECQKKQTERNAQQRATDKLNRIDPYRSIYQ